MSQNGQESSRVVAWLESFLLAYWNFLQKKKLQSKKKALFLLNSTRTYLIVLLFFFFLFWGISKGKMFWREEKWLEMKFGSSNNFIFCLFGFLSFPVALWCANNQKFLLSWWFLKMITLDLSVKSTLFGRGVRKPLT